MQQVGDEGALRETPLPPGWDEAVDLEAPPATIPDPAEVDVPDELRREIERLHVALPRPPLGRPCRRSARRSGCTAGARPRRSTRSPP